MALLRHDRSDVRPRWRFLDGEVRIEFLARGMTPTGRFKTVRPQQLAGAGLDLIQRMVAGLPLYDPYSHPAQERTEAEAFAARCAGANGVRTSINNQPPPRPQKRLHAHFAAGDDREE